MCQLGEGVGVGVLRPGYQQLSNSATKAGSCQRRGVLKMRPNKKIHVGSRGRGGGVRSHDEGHMAGGTGGTNGDHPGYRTLLL